MDRLQSEYGLEALNNLEQKHRTMRGFKIAYGKLGEKIWTAWQRVLQLEKRRAAVPRRVPVQDAIDKPVVKLAPERKHLTNLIKMVAYQAESDLLRLVAPHYRRADDEGRTFIQAALASAADLKVTKRELRVTLAPQSSPHRTRAIAALCEELNRTKAALPGLILAPASTRSRSRHEEKADIFETPMSGVLDSYWNTDTTAFPAAGGNAGTISDCIGEPRLLMIQQSTFTNWNFWSVWSIDEQVELFPTCVALGLNCRLQAQPLHRLTWNTVQITWVSVGNGAYYGVFRSDSLEGPKTLLTTNWVPSTNFVDTTAQPLANYYYWVKAGTTPGGGRGSELSCPGDRFMYLAASYRSA